MGSVLNKNVVLVILSLFLLLALYSMNAHFFALEYKKLTSLQISKYVSCLSLSLTYDYMSKSMVMWFTNRFKLVREKKCTWEKHVVWQVIIVQDRNNGPSIEPCGALEVMMRLEEMETLIFTDWVRFEM